MPRQRVPDPEDPQVDLRMHRGRGRPPKAENEDPRIALPSGVVLEEKHQKQTKNDRTGSDMFSVYVRNLASSRGDPIPALAATYGISVEEATERAQELHDKIRVNSRSGMALQEMLERHDLTREVRIAILRGCLFHDNPAVQLKAIEMLEEVDMTAKAARIGSSWEDLVRMVKEKASKPKRK